MEKTGKVRRIDELGRIVIPIEVRRAMKLREGDPMEIYVNDDYISFKRYSYGEKLADSLRRSLNHVKECADQWEITRDTARQLIPLLEEAVRIAGEDGLQKHGKDDKRGKRVLD